MSVAKLRCIVGSLISKIAKESPGDDEDGVFVGCVDAASSWWWWSLCVCVCLFVSLGVCFE